MITAVIGIGNGFRQDDGIGIALVRRLRAALPEDRAETVCFVEASGEGLALIDAWGGCERVVIFDAIRAQGQPGRRLHLVAQQKLLPTDFFQYSSHAFSLAEAVELARAMDMLPPQLHVFGVEGEQFGFGEQLSPAVSASCDELLGEFAGDDWEMIAPRRADAADPGAASHEAQSLKVASTETASPEMALPEIESPEASQVASIETTKNRTAR